MTDKAWTRLVWFLLAFMAAVGLTMALTPKAHADMCGPTPGLPSYSFPWIKSCRAYVPFTGGLIPAIPVIPPPNGNYPIPGIGGVPGLGAIPGLGGVQPGSSYSPLTAP